MTQGTAPLSSFEVLAESLVPNGILPPGSPNPYLIQGFFVQVTVPSTVSHIVSVNLLFTETTGFNQGAGRGALQAQIIDSKGKVQIYDEFFHNPNFPGFSGELIVPGDTVIYGIQALPQLAHAEADVSLPQAGTGWRGLCEIFTTVQQSVVATPTQRLVYYTDASMREVKNSTVYSVPTFSGGSGV